MNYIIACSLVYFSIAGVCVGALAMAYDEEHIFIAVTFVVSTIIFASGVIVLAIDEAAGRIEKLIIANGWRS